MAHRGSSTIGASLRWLFLAVLCVGGTAALPAQRMRFEKAAAERGTINTDIICIAQDRAGFMWFGSSNGLQRFDGYEVRSLTHDPARPSSLSNNRVNAIVADSSGDLWLIVGWINSGWSVNRYRQSDGVFVNYSADGEGGRPALRGAVRSVFKDSRENIWVCTEGGGLWHYERSDDRFRQFAHAPGDPSNLCSDSVLCIAEASPMHYWVATRGGLEMFDAAGNAFRRIAAGRLDSLLQGGSRPSLLYADSRKRLWMNNWSDGIYRFDPNGWSYAHYRNVPGDTTTIGDNVVNAVFEDSRGIFWFGTNRGVTTYDPRTERMTTYYHNPDDLSSLNSNMVFSLYEDRGGILWIGSIIGGPNRYDRRKSRFTRYEHRLNDPTSLPGGGVSALYEDRERQLWIGADKGLSKLDPDRGRYTHFRPDPKDPGSFSDSIGIKAICGDHSGGIWIGTTRTGLHRYDPRTHSFEHFRHAANDPGSISDGPISCLLVDHEGVLWVGTDNGLDRFNRSDGTFTHVHTESRAPNNIAGNRVTTLAEDRHGNLWIGVMDSGFNLLDSTRERATHFSYPRDNHTGTTSLIIIAAYIDSNDVVWAGTWGDGLDRFDRRMENVTHLREENGLAGNFVKGILPDRRGNLWISTNKGISKFNPVTRVIENFDKEDGLSLNEFASHSFCQGANGIMYFGGWEGFVGFHPDSVVRNSHIPAVALSSFKLFDADSVYGMRVSALQRLDLSYEEDYFSIEFAALDFANPAKNQFSYWLEGSDKDWISCGTRHYAGYTHLDPGEYVFHLRGTNNDGVWSSTELRFPITINPPFWRTTWSKALVGLLFIATGPIIYYRRTSQLKKERLLQERLSESLIKSQEQERKRIAAELHDSIGQSLLIIKNKAVLGLEGKTVPAELREQMNDISSIAAQSIGEVRAIAHNLRPYLLDRLGLTKAIAAIIRRVNESSAITFTLHIDDLDGLFSESAEIMIYRIIQEGVNNIIKHSGAQEARFALSRDRSGLHIRMEDSGKGFDPEILRKEGSGDSGLGLRSMMERVRILHGTIDVRSERHHGATINIYIPSTRRPHGA